MKKQMKLWWKKLKEKLHLLLDRLIQFLLSDLKLFRLYELAVEHSMALCKKRLDLMILLLDYLEV